MATTIAPDQLPAVIRNFLSAHGARDVDAALTAFAPTAVVVDEGGTFRGTDEILRFLREGGSQFTYTTELIAAERVDAGHWVATHRLVGDFPGGITNLDYRFTTADDLIAELVIAP